MNKDSKKGKSSHSNAVRTVALILAILLLGGVLVGSLSFLFW